VTAERLRGQRRTARRDVGTWNVPAWSHDGRELLFGRERKVLAVSVETTPDGIRFGPERTVLKWQDTREFDVGPEGSIYGLEPVPEAEVQTSLQVRTGWFSEVERLAGR